MNVIQSEINKLTHLLTREQNGILRFGGARMALLDIEAGFWGLRRQMEALVGRQLTDNALQQAGANGGASFARTFAPNVTVETATSASSTPLSRSAQAVSAFHDCVAAYQAAGFGQFEVEVLEWPLGRVQIRGQNTFEAWMMQQHSQPADHPACAYTAGVLVGFINVLTDRKDIVCIQRTCQAQGAESCLFELLPASEAERTAVVSFDPIPGFTDQTNQTALHQASDPEMHELSTLLAISRNVTSTLEIEPLIGRILDQFKAIVAYEGASVLALDEDTLQVLAYRGPIPQEEALQLRFPLAESGANQVVLQRREPIIIPDVRDDTSLAHAFRETAAQQLDTTFGYIRSWMGVPLIVRDRVIGMLSLDHSQPDAYTGRHSLLALTFANKVAVAIENARLYQEEQERRRELQTLLGVTAAANSSLDLDEMLRTTLDHLVDLVGAARAGVMLPDETTGQLAPRMLRPEHTITPEDLAELTQASQKILAGGEPRYIEPDIDQGFLEPGAFIPLRSRGQALGLLGIIGREGSRFNQGQLALFQSIADQLAVAVENARLYTETRQRADEARTMFNVQQAITSRLEAGVVLQMIVDEACRLTAGQRAVVFMLEEDELRIAVAAGEVGTDVTIDQRIPLAGSLIEQVIETRKPVCIADAPGDPHVLADPGRQALIAQGQVRALLIVPLIVGERPIGAIAVSDDRPGVFGDDDEHILLLLAGSAAVSLENARLYAQAQQAAVTEERHRLARELHDAVTQTLFSASLIAEVLPRIWENDQQQGEQRLEELRELTRGALAEMRALLLELRPAALTESSMGELLRQLREAFVGRARLAIDLMVEGERPLPPDVQVAFYRIVQEALHNVSKHSGADTVTIQLRYAPDAVQLSVQDNGRGFDVGDIRPNSLGVGIMRERAAKIGAAFNLGSQIGEGTMVTVRWPLEEGKDE